MSNIIFLFFDTFCTIFLRLFRNKCKPFLGECIPFQPFKHTGWHSVGLYPLKSTVQCPNCCNCLTCGIERCKFFFYRQTTTQANYKPSPYGSVCLWLHCVDLEPDGKKTDTPVPSEQILAVGSCCVWCCVAFGGIWDVGNWGRWEDHLVCSSGNSRTFLPC